MPIPDLLKRQALLLTPDPSRLIVRPFRPATEPRDLNPVDRPRTQHIIDRIMALTPEQTAAGLADVRGIFGARHSDLTACIEARAIEMTADMALHPPASEDQRQLIGAYFLHEYSFEASALFNPSIVAASDQTGAPEGGIRFILSLRAVGEGHISSLTFRSGEIDRNGEITLDPVNPHGELPSEVRLLGDPPNGAAEIAFRATSGLSERVIFPLTPAQSNGIEDARFVAFEDDDGPVFHATYTAYSGRAIHSELITTRDFMSFSMRPLSGDASTNKGMALFPRKIGGQFAMIGRQDNENLYLMTSDDLMQWCGGRKFLSPQYPWEFVQIGTCGSPIELDEGWLLFTHGVGPLRKYSIGAVLLDLADPSIVLGRTVLPLVDPDGWARTGYVPNVVYTCGGLRFGELIILPYAVCDTFCAFATVKIEDLLADLLQ